MARMARFGDRINGYEILELLHHGMMACSYAARSPLGVKVFLKQYKYPSPAVPWYRDYVDYQRELKRRIESTPAGNFTYRFLDSFEANWGAATYFQVFEFVEKGHDLEQMLNKARKEPECLSWEKRLTFAKVLCAAVGALHKAGIVHADLKPANIQLYEDDSITTGYRLKLIDMDFSILTDRPAPWHGPAGYVGTPNYFSPEHLSSAVPGPHSDVFTCGLVLYDLLAQGHPYRFLDEAVYQSAVRSYRADRPQMLARLPHLAHESDVIEIVYRCLDPDASRRPSAAEILMALSGRKSAKRVLKRCPKCGTEHATTESECQICLANLRWWCEGCTTWVDRPRCENCGASGEPPSAVAHDHEQEGSDPVPLESGTRELRASALWPTTPRQRLQEEMQLVQDGRNNCDGQSKPSVFISSKSEDYRYAVQVFRFLESRGIHAFFSLESLPALGSADYQKQIDLALERAMHLVVVTSSFEYVNSPWVEAEWRVFVNEKRSGRKAGNVVTVVVGDLGLDQLPLTLRYYEVMQFKPETFERLLAYVGSS